MPKRSHDTPKPKQRTPFLIPEFEIIIMAALASQLRIFVSVFDLFSEVIVVVRFISVYIFLLPAGLSQIL